jgi:glycosyltransferase involved in cell wall biosynthesis
MKPMITIAVCTRDRPDLLQRCLASLRSQLDAQTELLVVDSASSSPEVMPVATASGARYVATDRPGLDVARNLALRSARGAIIAFIDDDAVAAPEWIGALRDSFADPAIACVTGRVLPLELRTEAQCHFEEHFSFDRGADPIRFTRGDDRPWFLINPWLMGTGCNMAFRRQAFDRIGPFDEALDTGTPTGGGGDIDIFRRLLRAGFVAVYEPAALVYHQHRVSRAELYRQIWGYGKSFTALMTKSLLVEREMAREARSLAFHRLRKQGRRFARRLLRRRGPPLSLILLETLGHVVGPLAFLCSLRRAQRQWLHHLQPAQVSSLQLDHGLPDALEVKKNHDLYLLVKQNGRPRGSLLIENPGPAIDRERLSGVVRTLESKPVHPLLEPLPPQRVSTVVCTRNGSKLLHECLEGLRDVEGALHEILVVDGRSDPRTAQVAADYWARVIREEQGGLCRARNRGLIEAYGDIVAFVDDDLVVDIHWLAALKAGFADPSVSCVSGPVLPLELGTAAQQLQACPGGLDHVFERGLYRGSLTAALVDDVGVGANIAFRREALLRHGPFDEALDPAGAPACAGSSLDMLHRILMSGEAVLYEPAMLARHRYRGALSDLRLLQQRYSMGTTAAYAKWAFHGDRKALRLGLGWSAWHVRRIATSLLGLELFPPVFPLARLYGAVLGPFAYARARWQFRRRQPVQSASQECIGGWYGAPGGESALSARS